MQIRISSIITGLIGLALVMGFAYLLASPSMKVLQECEKRGWDGSEYNTGVKEMKLFEENKEIIVKCNKAPEETDAMIDIFDALPFVDIKGEEK